MSDFPYLELIKGGSTVGFLAGAVYWLSYQFTKAQAQIISLLTGTLSQNTELLREVRDTLKKFHDHKP